MITHELELVKIDRERVRACIYILNEQGQRVSLDDVRESDNPYLACDLVLTCYNRDTVGVRDADGIVTQPDCLSLPESG